MREFRIVTLRCVAEVEGDGRTVTSSVAVAPEVWEAADESTRDVIRVDVRRQLLGAAERQLGFTLNAEDVGQLAVTIGNEPARIGVVRHV
ncbi:hypothetical protein ACIPW5_11545 [Streptomyces sp. NPDC090077]|uniref:hypothetical protein n=1 Tax=Streptomyces sp. NPDC090077 TaxID=3365938 RepID=UPI0038194934